MNEDLKKLIRLQSIDSEIIRNKAELAEIPARLKRTEVVLEGARSKETAFRERLERAKKERRSREQDLDEALARIKTLKDRVSEVKTNVEYKARLKEIETAETNARNLEDLILEAMERVEQVEKGRTEVEAALEEANQAWEQTKARVEESARQLESRNSVLMEERNSQVASIQPDLYETYKNLMREKNGLAVACIRDSVCQGCNMSTPPQFFNELRASEKIYHCPSCNRILFHETES